jgi:hypothetical protein
MELEEAGCDVLENPTWDQVEAAVRRIPTNIDGVALREADGPQIEAGGRPQHFCILYWSGPESDPLMIGKRAMNARRHRPTISGNRILVGPYERWSVEEALPIFRLFFDKGDLSEHFDLRDPAQEYSVEEIQALNRSEPS